MFGLSTLAFEKVASDRQIPVICVEVEAVKTLKKTHMEPSYVYCRPPKEWLTNYPERRDIYEGLASTEGFFDHTIDGEAVNDLYVAYVNYDAHVFLSSSFTIQDILSWFTAT